jgi:hypothetical protein
MTLTAGAFMLWVTVLSVPNGEVLKEFETGPYSTYDDCVGAGESLRPYVIARAAKFNIDVTVITACVG